MLVIYNITLIALPTPKQVLLYFGLVFIPLEILLLFSSISIGFALLITVFFGYAFALSYFISLQKKKLNKRSHQNGEILKALANNTKGAIFLVDYFSKEIWDANEKSKDIFGLKDIGELLNKQYYTLFSDENFTRLNKNEISQQISAFGHFQSEVLLKKMDGSEFMGDVMISPFKAAKNNYYLIQIHTLSTKKQ
jgi:PAS domain S-box-containing protein